MAQFTFTNNTYAGEALAGFMASTLLEADSVKRGLLTVINDVKSRKVILDVDDDVVLQDPSGTFADQGTTAGVYDIGVLQNNITAIISLLVFQFIAWNILCFIWPSIRIYFEENFTIDFNKLLPWQKIITSLLLYCFLIFCQVLLSKTISG